MWAGLMIVGPTASGKSELALRLAESWKGEIVSVDSMQVYRRLDVGTAKPSMEDRGRVPHHLLDVVDLSEEFDVARFVALAREAIQGIHARGHLPILCGGTGLYFRGLLEGIGEAPASDPAVRAELEGRPLAELLEALAKEDPLTYSAIDRENKRRVLRALVVVRTTGRSFSEQRANWTAWGDRVGEARWRDGGSVFRVVGVERETMDLSRRIEERVERMFAKGLVEETRGLLAEGLEGNRTAMQAIGYRQVVDYLHGRMGLVETVEKVKQRTRQYARRQKTWFRRQMKVDWLRAAASGDWVEAVCESFDFRGRLEEDRV